MRGNLPNETGTFFATAASGVTDLRHGEKDIDRYILHTVQTHGRAHARPAHSSRPSPPDQPRHTEAARHPRRALRRCRRGRTRLRRRGQHAVGRDALRARQVGVGGARRDSDGDVGNLGLGEGDGGDGDAETRDLRARGADGLGGAGPAEQRAVDRRGRLGRRRGAETLAGNKDAGSAR
nr:hypothetical protein CFP56_52510 [Quercus suber]